MDGKLDGYKLDRYELLDLVEWGHRRNDKLLSETEPITLQVIEHSFDHENGKVSEEPLHPLISLIMLYTPPKLCVKAIHLRIRMQ